MCIKLRYLVRSGSSNFIPSVRGPVRLVQSKKYTQPQLSLNLNALVLFKGPVHINTYMNTNNYAACLQSAGIAQYTAMYVSGHHKYYYSAYICCGLVPVLGLLLNDRHP